MSKAEYVVPFDRLGMDDIEAVGGKNASLGEMIGRLADTGVRIPEGFATTAFAFREFLTHNQLEGRLPRPAPKSEAGSRRPRFPASSRTPFANPLPR